MSVLPGFDQHVLSDVLGDVQASRAVERDGNARAPKALDQAPEGGVEKDVHPAGLELFRRHRSSDPIYKTRDSTKSHGQVSGVNETGILQLHAAE